MTSLQFPTENSEGGELFHHFNHQHDLQIIRTAPIKQANSDLFSSSALIVWMILKSVRLATAAAERLAGSQELSFLSALPVAASAGPRLEGRATGVLLPSPGLDEVGGWS